MTESIDVVTESPTTIEIKHLDGRTLWSGEAPDIRTAVLLAIASDADLQDADLQDAYLQDANLQDAYLRGANLQGADLQYAYLRGANLQGANLQDTNLEGADLRGADLQYANLQYADLRDTNLRGANFQYANFRGADLRYADLRGVNLLDADLQYIKDDLFDVLSCAPDEVPGLLAALREGRINGAVYTGNCACLVGTIAKVRGCRYTDILGLAPDGGRPAERWFLAILPGHTPENNPIAKVTAEWIEEWMAANPIAGTEPNTTEVTACLVSC